MSNTVRKVLNDTGSIDVVSEKTNNFDRKKYKKIESREERAKKSQLIKNLNAGNITPESL